MYSKQKSDKSENHKATPTSPQSHTAPRTMHRMSKAERYRWIFKDTKKDQNPQNSTSSSSNLTITTPQNI